jgi:hypothetical protein
MFVRLGRYANEEDDIETFKRDEDIVIHPYDTWSMDHTLALIIVPMLKQLKETKHGAPNVDASDVPMRLKPKQMDIVRYRENGETDENWFKRWDYVLDEMIWAFEQIADDDNDGKFYDHSECDPNEDIVESAKKLKVDREGLDEHHKRINNGTRLFGKYYRSLWD